MKIKFNMKMKTLVFPALYVKKFIFETNYCFALLLQKLALLRKTSQHYSLCIEQREQMHILKKTHYSKRKLIFFSFPLNPLHAVEKCYIKMYTL